MLDVNGKSFSRCIVIVLFFSEYLCESFFESKPVIVQTFENETVVLPCYVNNDSDDPPHVRWYRGSDLLLDSAAVEPAARARLLPNCSLVLDQLRAADSAHYTCEVIRPEPWGPIKQVHSVRVQYGPTVKTIPEDGFVEVKKGEYVDIGCEASGSPEPTISWKKNGATMQLLEHRSRMRFKAEHRQLAGVYQCVVANGVGDAVEGTITVTIEDAPVAEAVASSVHTALGLRAALAVRLQPSAPPARAAWFMGGRSVRTDDRVIQIVQDGIHQLIFRTVRLSDLGNYTFRAENKLGMVDVAIRLTAVPNTASFKIDAVLNRPSANSYTLIWEVDSYSTIIEYNLWLRPYYARPTPDSSDGFTTEQPHNRWSKIVVPGDINDGPIHSASYTVRGLTPSTVYEAIVTSRNRFGWSKPSAILHFATDPPVNNNRRPSTIDYSETPVLEELETERSQNSTQAQISERNSMTDASARETPSLIAILCSILVFLKAILS
ncbi:hypothetical protein JYU34_022291 [Plutella xylostella]|uniref:Uncharacterized protein n=1 Tax=Plutella xylostella TaxID=51655 RepID=A0ABQ7PQN9_PLUXY|nr:hypothetical protein JYU34_022291 [Plutella xylostella]